MAVQYAAGKKTAAAKTRILVAFIIGIAAALLFGSLLTWEIAPLVGWIVAAGTFVGSIYITLRRLVAGDTRDFALREDPSRQVTDAVLTFASLASLVAVGFVLVSSASTSGLASFLQIALGVLSVVASWVLIHTIFMLRYAELYYRQRAGGVDFEGSNGKPTFRDFAYLSFTMGMTFQVSDTGFQSTEFRALALRHALLSYVFGTVIVATTINLVAGLSK